MFYGNKSYQQHYDESLHKLASTNAKMIYVMFWHYLLSKITVEPSKLYQKVVIPTYRESETIYLVNQYDKSSNKPANKMVPF